MSPARRRFRRSGAWLSLLALYVPLVLPMLIAVQLGAAAADGSGSAALALCGGGPASTASHDAGAPGSADDHSRHCCPLCAAVGASCIVPAEFLPSAPATWSALLLPITGAVAGSSPGAATYEARAPPANG